VCEAIVGPNGGANACEYRALNDNCINNANFLDDEVEVADCSAGDFRRAQCEAIDGPNGRFEACKYKALTDKCINKRNWVDDPALNTADCSPGDYRKAQCEAIEGPNGGAGACIYKVASSECLNNPDFVNPSRSRGESPPPRVNPANIAVPFVAVALLMMAAYFAKSSRTQTTSTPRELRDQWFANNLVTADEASMHYYPPLTNGMQDGASLARSTTTTGSNYSTITRGWFGEP
jgi:hypothetical protein